MEDAHLGPLDRETHERVYLSEDTYPRESQRCEDEDRKGHPLPRPTNDGAGLKRGLRLLGALALMFALSSGGPYGLEEMVPAGGPGLAILVLGGTWLALLTSIGAQAGNLSLFNGELLITSRLPYAMAKDGVLPPFFARLHPRYGTPARFLIIQAIFYSAVTYSFSFVEILVISTWIAVPSYILLFLTPIMLRIRRPELRGPFRIPGGFPVLILCAVPPAAIAIYVLLTVSSDEALTGLGFFALPPLLYAWSKWSSRRGANQGDAHST